MNILDSSALRPCTSCQMCGAVCGRNAISFILNKDGFYRPSVNENCSDCGLCTNVCYRFDNDIRQTTDEDLTTMKVLAASALDDEVVRQTTSGGIGDILARQLVLEGYKVLGVVYDGDKDCAVHRIATTKDDTIPFRGSKYIQPSSVEAFRKLVQTARKEKYAVFGLPCQIYAISRYLERIGRREDCVLIDLYCHGCPSMLIWQKLSAYIKRKTKVETFDNVVWRSKKRGWGDYVVEAWKDGKSIYHSKPLEDKFYDLFFSDQLLGDGCNTCKIRGTIKYTDIRLGDYWGPKYRGNLRGVSGVTIASANGQKIIDSVRTLIKIEENQMTDFIRYQSWGQVITPDAQKRRKWLSMLADPHATLDDVIKLVRQSWSTTTWIKESIKQVLSYMPLQFQRIIRH